MSLKHRFLTQNLLVLISTIIITGCIGYGYMYFYDLLYKSPIKDNIADTELVIMENDQLIYQSANFSSLQIREILMNISFQKDEFIYKNIKYSLDVKTFTPEGHKQYQVIQLIPSVDLDNYYISFLSFIVGVFIITFMIANSIVQRRNLKNIINPIIRLKEETENLRLGALKTAITDEGYGEIKELGKAIEQLRIKLKDSVYYQQKYDSNRKFLISSISHDLKTPVTAIRGYIDGVLDGIANTDEKKREYLKKAVEKTKLINTMIDDLLLYSKLDLNQIPFKIEKIDIIEYIEDCVQDYIIQFELENKQIIFDNELTHEKFVYIDDERFKRVIQNIIDNARKNIQEGFGILTIKTRETKSSIILEFKDNGKGIKQEDLPHIFERFYRADFARKVEGSSGLGLAIAKQIVEGLGGRIWAISKAGEGASIIISLKKSS